MLCQLPLYSWSNILEFRREKPWPDPLVRFGVRSSWLPSRLVDVMTITDDRHRRQILRLLYRREPTFTTLPQFLPCVHAFWLESSRDSTRQTCIQHQPPLCTCIQRSWTSPHQFQQYLRYVFKRYVLGLIVRVYVHAAHVFFWLGQFCAKWPENYCCHYFNDLHRIPFTTHINIPVLTLTTFNIKLGIFWYIYRICRCGKIVSVFSRQHTHVKHFAHSILLTKIWKCGRFIHGTTHHLLRWPFPRELVAEHR